MAMSSKNQKSSESAPTPADFKNITLRKYSKKSSHSRPGLQSVLNIGEEEKMLFEQTVEFSSAVIKNTINSVNTFSQKNREYLRTLKSRKVSDPQALIAEVETDHVRLYRNVLQKIITLLSTFRIYEEESLYFDLINKPANIITMSIINLKPKYQEGSDVVEYLSSHILRLQNVISNMIFSFRGFIATQLYRRQVLVGKLVRSTPSQTANAKKWKTIKILLRLQNFVVDRSQSASIMKGFMLKKSKDGGSFSKNWKKYFFRLEHDRLFYSEKENDKNQKVFLTNTFQSVKDVTNDTKRSFSFQINTTDQPIVLSAPSEQEFKDWQREIENIIAQIHVEENMTEVDREPVWSLFTEEELFQFLRSIDREERYHTEMIRLIHLNSMQNVAKKTNIMSKEIPEDPEREKKIKEYLEKKNEMLKFSILVSKDDQKIIKELREDPTDYLSVLSGYNPADFRIIL